MVRRSARSPSDDTLHEPLSGVDARKLVRRILAERTAAVSYSSHATERMKENKLTMVDVVNILRCGEVLDSSFEQQTWRYRVYTNVGFVVVAFRSREHLRVITAFREKP